MWSEVDLASLDTISKGLRNVVIEPRQESDLWLRGSATLDSPLKEWEFEDPTLAASSSNHVLGLTDGARTSQLLYPLRVKFDVALANQPEYDFTAACLRHHYRTWKALAQSQALAPNEAIALHEGFEGLWAVTIDQSEEPLPAWWDRQIRRRIRVLEEIREDVRSSGSGLRRTRPTATSYETHAAGLHSLEQNATRSVELRTGDPSLNRPSGSHDPVLVNGSRRAVYDDDLDEQAVKAGEQQWLTAVDVLIRMAQWVEVLEARDYRLLMCRPRYFSVRVRSNASSPEAAILSSMGQGYFDLKMRSFAAVEQASGLIKPDSDMEATADIPDKIPEYMSPRKALARNMVEHGLRTNLRYIAPEVIAADHTAPDPSVDIFAWAVASYELVADRPIESITEDPDQFNLLDAVHHHSTRSVTSLATIHDTIPLELSQLIDKALALDPADRYPNASTLLQDLQSIRQICSGEMAETARADFIVGDIVRLSTFVFPPALLDREQEELRLDSLYTRIKLSGTPEVACCYGRSGSGKSQLIADWATKQELKNAGQDCLVGWAKLDQHLLRPLSGFIGVFCSLLDRVFSDPLEDPVRWKKDILDAVAANANLFLSLLPAEWQRVLSPDNVEHAVSGDAQTVDWNSYIKQFRSWATMLLRLFASRQRPLILVIDDYQWMEASERALWHELASVPSRRVEYCFIVLSYRTQEQDTVPDIAPLLANMIESRTFDLRVVEVLLLQSFHLEYMSTEWQTLAESILRASQGNPLFCNQILLAYVRDRVVHFDFEAKRWQIRQEAIMQYDAMSSEQYSGRTFSLLEPELQELLRRLACLPSRGVKVDLLAKTAKLSRDAARLCLKPAIDSGIIRIMNDEVLFSHDRHHLAAIASTKEVDKKGLYLSVAESLDGLSSPELIFVRADLLSKAYKLDESCVATTVLCRALLLATQRAIRGLASDLAQRYLVHAQAIWNFSMPQNWRQDALTTMLLVGSVAEVAIAKRAAASFIDEVRIAVDLAPTILYKIQVLTWLCRLYLAAERGPEGLPLVVEAYALAGVTFDLGKTAPKERAVVQEYARRPSAPVVTEYDRVCIALTILFTVMGPTIYVFIPNLGRQYFQTAGAFLLQERAAAALKFEASAYVFAILGLLALDELNLEMAASWLELSETIDVDGTPYQAASDIGRMVVRVIRCQRLSELSYTRVRENSIVTKNPDILIYVCGVESGTLLLSGHSISQILANAKVGYNALGDELPLVSRVMATSFLQLAHNLTTTHEEDLPGASVLQGEYVTEADVERIPTTPPFYTICYALASLVLGLLHNVPDDELKTRTKLLRQNQDAGNGTILQSMASALLAISTLVTKPPTEKELVEKAKAYFGHFTSNLNFVAMIHLLDTLDLLKQAEEGRIIWTCAIEQVEETLLLLHDAEAYLWEGFLCGRAAISFGNIGRVTARLAAGYKKSARKAYQRCGANALVGPVRGAASAPGHTLATPNRLVALRRPSSQTESDSLKSMSETDLPLAQETAANSGNNLQQRIGLESILRTSVLLASETDGEGLIRRVLTVLLQMTRTTHCCLAIQDHADGALKLRGYGDHESIQVCETALADAGKLCPASLLLHVSVTKKAINTTTGMDPAHHKLFEREPFFKSGGAPRSVIVSPIFVQGRLSGAIYLAARAGVSAASTSHVGLLATFACVVLASHHAYATLEAAVEMRTNQLEQALAHRQTFISAISHELRTPLFAVAGLCNVMESATDLAPEHRENLSIIKQSSEDLQRIVTAVLDWSKLDAGSVQAESIDFDLRNIVESATVTVGHIAQAKSVEIVVENSVDTDPKWALLGDPHRFRQCLLNILSNALKFTPLSQSGSRPTIQIRWSIDERNDSLDVTVAVQDEGIGIPRKAMNKLFGAFVQVDVGTARNYGGTGLGLSITRGLCRAMGGDCWAESVEGKGSTFYLLISTKKTQKPNKPPWMSLSHVKQQAALVTDMPCRFDSLRCNLRNWNVHVEALEALEGNGLRTGMEPFDLVILDITSTAHAQDAIAKAKTSCPGARVVLLVGPAETEAYKKTAEINHWTVLSKPTTTHALYAATARVGTENNPGGRLLAAAEIGRKASPSVKRPMGSLMDKTYGQKYPLKILYVDDSKVNVKVGQKILERFGYRNIDTAEDGRIAVTAAEQTAYDLIFMDLQMPEMDGYTARNMIHAKQGKDCPAIVALTANTDDATKERCMEEGFFHFLSKPLNIKSLTEVLQLAYENRHPPPLKANATVPINGK